MTRLFISSAADRQAGKAIRKQIVEKLASMSPEETLDIDLSALEWANDTFLDEVSIVAAEFPPGRRPSIAFLGADKVADRLSMALGLRLATATAFRGSDQMSGSTLLGHKTRHFQARPDAPRIPTFGEGGWWFNYLPTAMLGLEILEPRTRLPDSWKPVSVDPEFGFNVSVRLDAPTHPDVGPLVDRLGRPERRRVAASDRPMLSGPAHFFKVAAGRDVADDSICAAPWPAETYREQSRYPTWVCASCDLELGLRVREEELLD